MSESITPASGDTLVVKETSKTTAPSSEDVKPAADHMIPKSRFDEVRLAKEAAETKLKEIETADLMRKGEYEKVIADYKPKAERADKLEAVLAEHLETVMKEIPEDRRSMIDDLPNASVAEKLDYINKHRPELMAGKDVPKQNTGTPLNPSNNAEVKSPQEFTQELISAMSPDEYRKNEGAILKWISGGAKTRFSK